MPDTGTHPPEWLSQEEPGTSLTTSAPVADVSAPACTNGAWPVSVAQKNKPLTMLSSNVQSIDLCMAWRLWTMRQLNGWSAPAPRSSVAKQWFQLGMRKQWKCEVRKFYRFHIGYLTWKLTWRKCFVHFRMWIKLWSCTRSWNELVISVAREKEIKHN